MKKSHIIILCAGLTAATSCQTMSELLIEDTLREVVNQQTPTGGKAHTRKVEQQRVEARQEDMRRQGQCPVCFGSGKSPDGKYECSKCKGTGKLTTANEK